MKIDLKILDGIMVQKVNNFFVVDTEGLGLEIGLQFIDIDEIWQSDIIYEINLYMNDIVNKTFDKVVETLKENGRDIDIEK